MHINLFKQAKLGSLVFVGVLATSVAHAVTFNIGGYEVNMDTTVSTGVTYLTSDRNNSFLPESNGGNPNQNLYFNMANYSAATDLANPTWLATNTCNISNREYGGFCQDVGAISTIFNHDGSINSDDGRLNFDQGDIVSAPTKVGFEFETRSGNIQAFLRTTMYYDAVLMDDGSFERGGLTDKGESNAGREFNVLDAFVTVDGDAAGMPYMVRVGRQVINWGENTFIPGGNSSFNPIDVAALRRPGAEIKDALLPVEAIYGSLAVTDALTIEAYYGGWDDYKLDAGGTLFGASDTFTPGTQNGNGNQYFIGGGATSGPQFACDTAGLTAANLATSAAISAVMQGTTFGARCTNSPNIELKNAWTAGASEQERIAAGDRGIQDGANIEGDEAYGLAVRYYAENFNSTEFGFYYQVADSRLPYISYRTAPSNIVGTSTTMTASTVSRGAAAVGLGGILAGSGYLAAYNPLYNTISVEDPHGIMANATLVGTAQAALAGYVALQNSLGETTQTSYTMSSTPGTIARFQEMNAGLILAQLDTNTGLSSSFDSAGQLPTGATFLGFDYDVNLFAEHPEIETWGFSFNTNIGGHTVQGDFNYRPDMPLQIDTDVITINALFNACAFTSVGVFEGAYQLLATLGNERGNYNTMTHGPGGVATPSALASGADSAIGCRENSYIEGWVEEYDVSSWNIGTTSIFTSSNPVVQGLGADVGIFVTDFQGITVPDIYEERGAPSALAPMNNHCVGGSDLPLNGILSIDSVLTGTNFPENAAGRCRSTDSWGMTLLASLQYNNAFGTPLTVTPQFVY